MMTRTPGSVFKCCLVPDQDGRAICTMGNRLSAALRHWGLDRWPFSGVPAAAQFYPTAGHEEALARIDYLVAARRRLGVLVGGAGLGKTMLLEVAASRLARAGKSVAKVDVLGLSTRELLWLIASGLKAAPPSDAEAPRLWRLVADRVAENGWQQVDTVLLVDDAGQAGPDVLMQLTRLARLDGSAAAAWTIILAAEPGQAAHWRRPLVDLVDLRIEVEPWEPDDTIGYVQTALVEAGSSGPLFDDGALETLHELAGGVPRRVIRLAEFALLAGAAAGTERVDGELVRAAGEEVAWPAAVGTY